jgi:hypothetical protein
LRQNQRFGFDGGAGAPPFLSSMFFSDRGGAMFQRWIYDFKGSVAAALRLSSLAAAAAIALFIALGFLCAALFVFVLQNYGPVQACLAGAAIFLAVTLIAAICYVVRRNQIRAEAERAAKAAPSMLADPMVMAAGLQIVRAIGVKRLIPIIAVAGLALGLMASRGAGASASASPDES